ncbi:hypothetical protein [Mucilaginibacter sp.]|uniref:hypothetical protein n=1 Tax=Mucilaginibacter sp. TaxID=1882438 RepID=UPI00261E3689|nr:hypothetical protein [Mucilaginibacter sp.]MDB4921215.1 hypothetical protein [Mucilaginibacter sp.]
MVTYQNIEDNIISCLADDLPENMIGAAIVSNEDGSQHAAIFIRYNGESQMFHFTGKNVMIEDVLSLDEAYYHKRLDFIDPILLPAFLAQCELVLEKAQPKFGYFYDGALYNANGDFLSPSAFPEYMTCVGFCLNVIKGFLSDQDYFTYTDWDSTTLDESYAINFVEKVKEDYPDINLADFKANLRRIFPIEFLSGAFADDLPVAKSFINNIKLDVQDILERKLVA